MTEHVRLEIIESGAKRGLVDLPPGGGQFAIGRHNTCDVVLTGNGISRHHALLIVHKGERVVHDLGSRNGTYVNGRELRKDSAAVGDGDTVRLGPSILLRVSISDEPIEKALKRLEPPKRYTPKSGPAEIARAAERARHCEVCDAPITPNACAVRSGALWLDDGSFVCPTCTPSLPSRDRIAQRYRVLAKLGEGGVASVMKVIDENVRRVVALKMMKAESAGLALQYLEREIEILRDLDHPAIVGLHDAGEHEGKRFFVMDLVRGADLNSIIETRGHVPAAHAT
ncbi:FHA domain-containing protein, partial [bacterium]|nr:FHA domain-containing protein [bacterium]